MSTDPQAPAPLGTGAAAAPPPRSTLETMREEWTARIKERESSDWLSPMLVKELRQGMRGKLFASAFQLVQAAMLFTVFISMTAGSQADPFFWVILAVPLVLIIPLNGFGSVYAELRTGTIELVFLTRLSALRIVAGKWVALMAQASIFACSVLPYAVLRYFLSSGTDIIAELLFLMYLVLGCGLFTAIGVALSPIESRWLRPILLIGAIIGLCMMLISFTSMLAYSAWGTGGGGSSYDNLGTSLLYIAIYYPASLLLALELSATQIAPIAENHATRKRLLGWTVLGVGTLAALFTTHVPPAASLMPAFILLGIIFLDALCEEQTCVPSVYVPFVRYGILGRLASWFLAPGWVSGLVYTTVTYVAAIALCIGAVVAHVALGGDWVKASALEELQSIDSITSISLLLTALYGSLIFPLALLKIAMPRLRMVFAGFIIIYLISPFFSLVLAAFQMLSDIQVVGAVLICFCPPTMLSVGLFESNIPVDLRPVCIVFSLVANGMFLAALAFRGYQAARDIRRAEEIAGQIIAGEGKPLEPLAPVAGRPVYKPESNPHPHPGINAPAADAAPASRTPPPHPSYNPAPAGADSGASAPSSSTPPA
ncbi:hypothetical protein DB346_13565 [Verrucomicrobia bacterium LW23]|nr:hypothetical protein DB346_13565 [Verrucomicrobia bacterium LW23]